jgi:hypothetical protein
LRHSLSRGRAFLFFPTVPEQFLIEVLTISPDILPV